MRCLQWSLLCAAILVSAMLVARHIGAQSSDSVALSWLKSLYSAECALPECWHAIRFGSTTVRQAATLLAEDDTLQVEVLRSRSYGTWVVRSYRKAPPHGVEVGFSGQPDASLPVTALWMHLPEGTLRVGELIAAFGAPQWAWLCAPEVQRHAVYRLGVLRFTAPISGDGRLTPHAPLRELEISLYPRRNEPSWQGFTYRARHTAFAQRLCR